MIDQQAEYDLMRYSDQRTIKVQIPGGPELTCGGSWDYMTDLSQTTLKTLTEVKITHPLLKVEKLNLLPISARNVWKITVLRRPESNLKNNTDGNNSINNRR
jgi:hypothetical protein